MNSPLERISIEVKRPIELAVEKQVDWRPYDKVYNYMRINGFPIARRPFQTLENEILKKNENR